MSTVLSEVILHQYIADIAIIIYHIITIINYYYNYSCGDR